MQPCSREMLGMNINSLLNKSSQISTQELQQQQRNSHSQINQHQIQSSHFESPMSHDDFLEQMLSTLGSGPSSWAEQLNSNNKSPWDTSIPNNGLPHHHNSNNNDNNQPRDFSDETVPADYENVAFPCDESSNLASKFRDHQINGGSKSSAAAAASMFHQQLMMSRGIAGASEHGIISMPLSPNNNGDFDRSQNDVVDGSSFKSPSRGSNNPIQSIYNGFGGSLHGASQVSPTQTQHFHHPQGNSMQAQSYGAPGAMMSQPQPPATGSLSGATTPSQARPRVRARRGQATDPHSIAERLRRERIAERMKSLQELVPNGNKTDKASMLDEIIDYVKFLQLQVKVLSMSRLGGAASVAPNLGADMSSKGGGDCIQTNENGGTSGSHGNNQTASSSNNDSMTVTEHQVAKLMEEDMGSAMQYLQGKGLCLMPISLATAISTSTCHARSPMISNTVMQSNGEGPSSPSISVLTVQSATLVNGGPNNSVKDAVSVSVSVSVSEL